MHTYDVGSPQAPFCIFSDLRKYSHRSTNIFHEEVKVRVGVGFCVSPKQYESGVISGAAAFTCEVNRTMIKSGKETGR